MVKPLFDPTFYDYEQQMLVDPSVKPFRPDAPEIRYEPTDEELIGAAGWIWGTIITVVLGVIAVAWYWLKYR